MVFLFLSKIIKYKAGVKSSILLPLIFACVAAGIIPSLVNADTRALELHSVPLAPAKRAKRDDCPSLLVVLEQMKKEDSTVGLDQSEQATGVTGDGLIERGHSYGDFLNAMARAEALRSAGNDADAEYALARSLALARKDARSWLPKSMAQASQILFDMRGRMRGLQFKDTEAFIAFLKAGGAQDFLGLGMDSLRFERVDRNQFYNQLEKLAAVTPVRRLEIDSIHAWINRIDFLEGLAESPSVRDQLQHLSIDELDTGEYPQAFRALRAFTQLEGFKVHDQGTNGVHVDWTEVVALPRLKHLRFPHFGDRFFEQVVSHFPQLETLDVLPALEDFSLFDSKDAAHLKDLKGLVELSLRVEDVQLDTALIKILTGLPLRKLVIEPAHGEVSLSRAAAVELAKSETLQELRLDRVAPGVLGALAAGLPELRVLDIEGETRGTAEIHKLGKLHSVHLHISKDAVSVYQTLPKLRQLSHLKLMSGHADDVDGVSATQVKGSARAFGRLKNLLSADLDRVLMGEDLITALTRGSPRLQALQMREGQLNPKNALRLAQHLELETFEFYTDHGLDLNLEGARTLKKRFPSFEIPNHRLLRLQ